MELNEQIGKNLKKLRAERNMTAAQLSELSGISSVMLSQIEKGVANPTINTLWKIANGLKVPYTMLLEPNEEEPAVVIPDEEKMQYSADGKCRLFCYYPVSAQRRYEQFILEMERGGQYLSPGHPQHSREYIIVSQGEIEMTVGEEVYLLPTGASLAFSAAVPHIYRNAGMEKAKAFLLNDYLE